MWSTNYEISKGLLKNSVWASKWVGGLVSGSVRDFQQTLYLTKSPQPYSDRRPPTICRPDVYMVRRAKSSELPSISKMNGVLWRKQLQLHFLFGYCLCWFVLWVTCIAWVPLSWAQWKFLKLPAFWNSSRAPWCLQTTYSSNGKSPQIDVEIHLLVYW